MKKVIKTVKSKKDLNKFALKTGAEVTDQHGRTFNAGGEKVDKKPLFKRQPKPALTEPEKPSADAELMAKTMAEMSENNRIVLEGLRDQISAIQLSAVGPITEWDFKVLRNDDEYKTIDRIVAKAGPQERTIN